MTSGANNNAKGERDEDAATDDSFGSLPHENDGFYELCQSLKEGDANTTYVKIGDATMDDAKAVELGQSLQGNTKVNTIVFDFRFVNKFIGSAVALLDYIQTSSSLTAVEVQNATMADGTACTVLIVLLIAVNKNPGIKELTMDSQEVIILDSLKALFYAATSITETLLFRSTRLTPAFLLKALAESFCQCQHLESLWLEHFDDNLLCQVLSKLHELKSLKSLVIVPNKHYSVSMFVSLGVLLTVNRSIEQLELHGCWFSPKLFDPLVRGLANSQTVNHLSLHDCSFDLTTTKTFQDLFVESVLPGTVGANHSIRSLMLGHNVKFFGATASVLTTIVTAPTCSLTTLDLSYCDLGGQTGIAELLAALVNTHRDDGVTDLILTDPSTRDEAAASKAKRNFMERLKLGMIHTEGELEVLKKSIPDVYGLREVSVQLGHDLDQYKKELVNAFKTNLTLEKCTIDDEEFLLKTQFSRLGSNITVDSSESDQVQPEDGENQLQGLDRGMDDEVVSISSDDGEEHAPLSKFSDGDDDLFDHDGSIQSLEHASGVEYEGGSDHEELNGGSSNHDEETVIHTRGVHGNADTPHVQDEFIDSAQ